jgi:hypothetical protein
MAKGEKKPEPCRCCPRCGNPFHSSQDCDYDKIVKGEKKSN